MKMKLILCFLFSAIEGGTQTLDSAYIKCVYNLKFLQDSTKKNIVKDDIYIKSIRLHNFNVKQIELFIQKYLICRVRRKNLRMLLYWQEEEAEM